MISEEVADMIRWFVVGEMVVLVWVTYFLHFVHAGNLPRDLQWMGRGVLVLTFAVATAVAVNAVAPGVPATPGLYVLAVVVAPVVLGGSTLTWNVIRTRIRQQRDYARLVEHLSHAEPCSNPDCISARAELKRIADH